MLISEVLNSVLVFLISVNVAYSDEVQRYVDDINKVVKQAKSYKYRVDNSDIYSKNIQEKASDFGVFDVIVVGAGSAGAVVAKRLSEYKFKTLLLEAGAEQSNMTDIPGIFKQFQKTDFNWGYKSAPQKHSCQGMVNHQCSEPRGKIMGGSSVLNAIIYARSDQEDQDSWKEEYGITGWSWNETLPYFKKMENYQQMGGDPKWHGMEGPADIDLVRPSNYLNNIFLNANREFYKVTEDYNGPDHLGAGLIQFNKKHGKRVSSNRAYLTDYDKKYLTIETNAFVTKVLIDDKTARGVEFVKDNKKFHVKAKKEVVLTAGAYNTPQILMLSGVGPKDELNKHKIPLVQDLPVGKNLNDHVSFVDIQFTSNLTITDKDIPMERHVWEYLQHTGPLTSTGMESIAFLSTDKKGSSPDIEILLAPSGRGLVPGINDYNYNAETLKVLEIPEDEIDKSFVFLVVLLHPKSRGTVTLQSNSPKDFPIIDQNSLTDDEDIARLYKALDYMKQLEKTKAFQGINAKWAKKILPGCKDKKFDSREFWECTIRHMSHHLYHPVGTAAMGKKGASVLDSSLKVWGIKGLRVADVSAAPKVNSGHTNALAMMIGEKAADIIKKDHSS